MASRDEVVRYIYELKGTKDLEKLVPVLDQLGDESGELSEEAAEMLRELRKLSQLSAQANALVQLKATLQETGDKLALAKIRAAELQRELSATAEPSSRLTRELERANRAVENLAASENRQTAELTRVRNALDAAGVSAADVGKAQATLRDRIDQTSDRLRTYAAEADRSDKASSKFGTTLLSIGKAAAGAVAAGLTAVAGLFKAVIGEADQVEQSVVQLNAALASTGNAAGYTAEKLLEMADAFESSSMFSREEIVGAQTRLLSYTDVVGEQFPAAMQIVIDQAARLGISVEQSAEMVGKALQTPSKAMESLGRQGFKLEEGQAELLRRLEATGKTAEAQAIIMDMLTESYGGAAAAARVGTIAGLWKGLKDAIGDFLERVGKAGPVDYFKGRLQQLADTIAGLAADGTLQRWAEATGRALTGVAQTTSAAFSGIMLAFNTMRTGIHSAAAAISSALGWIVKGFAQVAELDFQDKIKSQIAGVQSSAEQLNAVADSLFASATTNYEQAGAAADALVKSFNDLADAASQVGADVAVADPALNDTANALALSGEAADEARRQFAALPPHLQRIVGPALEAKGILTGLTDATANSAAAFKEQQEEIANASQRVRDARVALMELAQSGNSNAEAFTAANRELKNAEANLARLTTASKTAKEASGELKLAFEDLGITSQAQLDETVRKHKAALEVVHQAYLAGSAGLQDVVRAFEAYSESARAAAADGTDAMRQQVEQQLQVEASAMRLANVLAATGEQGKKAGQDVADGFTEAETRINRAADSAERMGRSADSAADGLDKVAEGAAHASTAIEGAGTTLGFMTQRAGEAISAARGFDEVRIVMAQYKDQIFATKQELDDFTRAQQEAADAASKASEELGRLLERMRDQGDQAAGNQEAIEERRYKKELENLRALEEAAGVGERQNAGEIRRLAEEEHRRKMREIQERRRAEIAAARDASDARSEAGASTGSSGPSGSQQGAGGASSARGTLTHDVRISVNGVATGGVDLNNPAVQRSIADAVNRALRESLRTSGAMSSIGARF